jgi:hypothetical protein
MLEGRMRRPERRRRRTERRQRRKPKGRTWWWPDGSMRAKTLMMSRLVHQEWFKASLSSY